MNRWISVGTRLVALFFVLALLAPQAAIADDDEAEEAAPVSESSDDDAWEEPESPDDEAGAPVDVDDDAGTEASDDDSVEDASDDTDEDGDDEFDETDDPVNDDGADSSDTGENIDQPIPDQAIVRLGNGVDPYALAARHDATVLRVIPAPNIALLVLHDARDDAEEVAELAGDPQVEWAELNYASRAPEGLPRYFFTSAASEPHLVDAAALPGDLAYTPARACVTGDGVTVAVLDTGVDASHPALADAILPNGVNMAANSWDVRDIGNGIDDDGDGRIDEMTGHGTHVSGTILQVAPDTNILPVKVLDSDGRGATFTVTAGIFYAIEQGADVINLSLGSTYDSLAIRAAVDAAASEGVVVVAAAGNANRQDPPEFPAADQGAISVAAVDAANNKAAFSNYHDSVDISAPGIDIASTYPGGRYTTASGTSMATPLVTGAVALVLERQPGIAPERTLENLRSTSDPLDLTDPALSGKMGSGELDIDAAIACGA